jgi:hypothetical protein
MTLKALLERSLDAGAVPAASTMNTSTQVGEGVWRTLAEARCVLDGSETGSITTGTVEIVFGMSPLFD